MNQSEYLRHTADHADEFKIQFPDLKIKIINNHIFFFSDLISSITNNIIILKNNIVSNHLLVTATPSLNLEECSVCNNYHSKKIINNIISNKIINIFIISEVEDKKKISCFDYKFFCQENNFNSKIINLIDNAVVEEIKKFKYNEMQINKRIRNILLFS